MYVRAITTALLTVGLVSVTLTSEVATATPVNCFGVEFQGKASTVCKVDVRSNQLRMFLRDPAGGLLGSLDTAARLADSQGERVQFAMNAGRFSPDRAPVGLLVIDGNEVSPLNLAAGEGNVFLKPNGVFLLTPAGVRIVESQRYPQISERVLLATQSGPLLLERGKVHPKLDPYSSDRLIRNGVGVQGRDQAVFAISDQPLNLYEFAKLFRDRLQCSDALHLDATVSSLLAVELRRNDRRARLGPIIAVSESLQKCGQPSRSLAEPECLGTGPTSGPDARR
jgi:uncharacterized protein YigE (DUF2233 family)